MTNPNSFYGGGHGTGSASDFVFWCLRAVTVYQGRKDLFNPPVTKPGIFSSYGRIQNCLEMAGVVVPSSYTDLYGAVMDDNGIISPEQAYRLRGAVLLNQGTVTVSLGDGQRVIVEENYHLIMKYVNTSKPASSVFEFGAKLPGVTYL